MTRLREVIQSSRLRYHTLFALMMISVGLLSFQILLYSNTAFLSALAGVLLITLLLLVETRIRVVHRLRSVDTAEAKHRAMLQCDMLTGAMTRRVFMAEMKAAVHEATSAQPFALFLIDLDHFKTLNDTYGHNVGDFALQHMVEAARKTFPDGRIGRLGGDEFAVLLRGGTEEEWLAAACDFATALRHLRFATHREITLGASIGIAATPQHTEYFDELPLLADLALYQAKRTGRSRAVMFDAEMLKDQRQRRNIERDLRAAILLNELELHYQPIVRGDRTVQGVEALVRWRHPLHGMMPPASFVPIAEESDLIDMLGEWVLRQACRDFAALPGTMVTVNVSAAQFARDRIIAAVDEALRQFELLPENLVLEITEGVALSTRPGILARIETLRRMGVRFALDDFGSGNSGFNYLRHLPVDIVKIDRSYVSRLGGDAISQVFVSAVVETARILDLTVVAEGIETENEWLLTHLAGCTLFQGYHFNRPQTLDSLRAGSVRAA